MYPRVPVIPQFGNVPVMYRTFFVPEHASPTNLLSPKVLELCDSVEVLRRVLPATPYGNPGCLPLSNPTKCRKLGSCRNLAKTR
jgi:hypothetical protein